MANKVIVAVTRIKMDGKLFEPGSPLDFGSIDRTAAKARIQELYDVGAIRIATLEPEEAPESDTKTTPESTDKPQASTKTTTGATQTTTTTGGSGGITAQPTTTGTSGPVISDVKSNDK